MFAHVGLYLPDSLYPDQSDVTEHKEAQPVRRKYFERQSMARDRNSDDRKAVALSRKSSDDVTRVFSSLSTVFDFADFASRQGKVSTESEDFLNLIQRVRQDVTQASQLSQSDAVANYLESWPDKKSWIDTILADVHRTLNDIGVYMETVRVSGDDGGAAALRRKFEWVLSHQKKLISKQQNLTACHSSLMAAVTMMQTAEMNAAFSGQDPVYEAPARPWIKDDDSGVLRSPHSRQRWRSSQRNLSLPSITVSEVEGDKVDDESINSTPAELPGSTPDDMPDPDNWDLYAHPKKPQPLEKQATQIPPVSQGNAQLSEGMVVVEAIHNPKEVTTYINPKLPPHSSESLPPRRSFDHGRPSLSSIGDPPRASFDQPRRRAYSDQVLPSRTLEIKPRVSFDQVRPLPTVSEKPLERYDSTASVSVSNAATVPLATMRYRPKAVHVKKPPVKHHSFPSTLPAVSSTSSLMDDLSHYVIPTQSRESYQSTDTNLSLDSSSPATSMTTSPVIPSPASCPAMINDSYSMIASSKPEILPTAGSMVPIEENQFSEANPVNLTSSTSTLPSTIESVTTPTIKHQRRDDIAEVTPPISQVEYSSKPAQIVSKDAIEGTPHVTGSVPVTASEPTAAAPQPLTDLPPHKSTAETSEPFMAATEPSQPPPIHSAQSLESASEPKFLKRVETRVSTNETTATTVSGASSPTSTRSSHSHHTVPRKPVPPPAPAPPMTALAKRRAAHSRRMQRMFEEN